MTIKPANVAQYLQSGCGRCAFGGTPQCKVHPWTAELRLLREIVQASGLTEEIKWGVLCRVNYFVRSATTILSG